MVCLCAARAIAGAPGTNLTPAQQETFLKTAAIGAARAAGEGVTDSKRITLSDGTLTHDAHLQTIDIFKPVYRTKTFTEYNFRDSYKYNVAAYRIAKLLGIDYTPVCVYRVVEGTPASVCWWIDNVQFDEKTRRDKNVEPPDPNAWTTRLNDIRVFDQLVDNTDRTQENLLIDKDWNLWMIDHSRAFRINSRLRKPENLRRVSKRLLTALRGMGELRLAAATQDMLTQAEIRSVLARRDLLLKFFDKAVADSSPEAVFTDIPVKTPEVTVP
jgi:hypothetical protein